MHTKQNRIYSLMLVLILTLSALLTGCLPRVDRHAPTTAAPFTEESQAEYEQYDEKRLLEKKRFAQMESQLFREEIGTTQIDLHFLLKDPAAYGISQAEYLYTPMTEDFMAQSKAERAELQATLDSFDLSLLGDDQKTTARILQSYLKTQTLGDGLELYSQPLATTIGTQAELPILLCEYCFYEKQDIDDYLKLLAGIDEYYAEILAFEQKKAEAGLMMSDTSIDHVIESCESYLLVPGDNFMIDSFNSRLLEVPDLTEEEKKDYQAQNTALLESDFVPAYQLLIDGLQKLKGTGINESGQCGFPDGKAYYKYLVFSNTGTSYSSVEDLLEAVRLTMENSLKETSQLLKDYPELAEEFSSYQFRQTEPTAIMEELEQKTLSDFPALPECSYTLKDVPKALELSLSPAFYLSSALDDSRDNTIYINRNERFSPNTLYNTLAHEGYPGHLYQKVYFNTNCKSDLRKILMVPGYSEGWATYVEQLSYSLDNGLKPELGRMLAANAMASLGLHATLDISINYLGWNKDQVRDYLKNYYSEPDALVDPLYDAMVENPANYLSYYVGCMEFQNMRQTAEETLGARFNAKEFHRFLLDMGNAPFDVIQPYFSTWLMGQKL
ncbi:MAG: DUF885 domain-containing protein [Lachnospiraceae bacterium]|nr:DUF885 domain-containing protein [Lachnospiraceae bacterium]